MPHHLSRRRFLKAAGMGLAALAGLRARPLSAQEWLPGSELYDFKDATISFNELYGYPPLLGRVHGASWIRVFKGPSIYSGSVRNLHWGTVIPIYRSAHGTAYDARAHSTVWFETLEGWWVHSAYVVPCHEHFQEPLEDIGGGFWGEITKPHSWQFSRPSLRSYQWDWSYYMNFWGQVHRVIDRAEDEEGRVWYRIYDDVEPNRPAWVMARDVRPVRREELEPISPQVQDKWIHITLADQMLTCYENGVEVFKTRIASGSSFTDDEGNIVDFSTVEGDYRVERKRPSRRMRGGDEFGLPYDVNGVPWCTYFGLNGAAIHGAYWHNNYGRPRSHGCINVTPDAAKWIYRWTQPYLAYDEEEHETAPDEAATRVTVT